MTSTQVLLTILISAAVTVFTRALPFLIFAHGKKPPAFITWLGRQLPRAVMAMLVIYCLKDVDLATAPHGAPALIAVAVTAALHVWKKQMILSIFGGTAMYMVLLRVMGG